MKKSLRVISVSLTFGLLLGSLALQAQTAPTPAAFKLGAGFDYSRGSYGFTRDTEVWSAPAIISYEGYSWLFRATVPWVGIKGPASVVGNGGPVIAGPARPTTRYESGLGDVVVSATLHTNPSSTALKVDLTGRAKIPTADEAKGLGTGETDYYAQMDLYQTFDRLTPFGTVGYRFLGNSPTSQVNDGWYASGGLILRTGTGTSIGASYDWRSRLVSGGDNSTNATVFLTHNAGENWNIVLYALTGFDSGSPDLGYGGQLTYKF